MASNDQGEMAFNRNNKNKNNYWVRLLQVKMNRAYPMIVEFPGFDAQIALIANLDRVCLFHVPVQLFGQDGFAAVAAFDEAPPFAVESVSAVVAHGHVAFAVK